MKKLGLTVVVMLVAMLVLGGTALAATPQDIYDDYEDNGILDGTYTQEELEAYQADATVHQYGNADTLDSLDELAGVVAGATKGIGGLADAPRSGKPPTYTEEAERRVLSQLDEDPPPGYARWNGPLLAQVLTNVSETQVWRILRRHGISLERRRSWCVSTDPEFDRKAADVVGLYLD